MKIKHILIIISAILIGWFIYDTLSLPSVSDLPGNFKEVAMYRNENNTGPITRIYAVSVEDTLWQEMQTYGDLMPHTKYGNTKVYYFLNINPLPTEVYPGQTNFKEQYQEFTVAKYEKNGMGQVSFVMYPYE
jgi:hypothetical protein